MLSLISPGRTIDALGRIVLPAQARSLLGVGDLDTLEVLFDQEQMQIVLRKPAGENPSL
mgnify:FL=1